MDPRLSCCRYVHELSHILSHGSYGLSITKSSCWLCDCRPFHLLCSGGLTMGPMDSPRLCPTSICGVRAVMGPRDSPQRVRYLFTYASLSGVWGWYRTLGVPAPTPYGFTRVWPWFFIM